MDDNYEGGELCITHIYIYLNRDYEFKDWFRL